MCPRHHYLFDDRLSKICKVENRVPTFHMNIFEDATIRENDIRVIRKAFNIQYPAKMADMCGVLEKRIEKACLVRMPFTRQCLRPILMRLRSRLS